MDSKELSERAKTAIEAYNAPIDVPADYDPHCTCGSLIPECPPCSAVSRQARAKREAFARAAVELFPALWLALEEARGQRDEALQDVEWHKERRNCELQTILRLTRERGALEEELRQERLKTVRLEADALGHSELVERLERQRGRAEALLLNLTAAAQEHLMPLKHPAYVNARKYMCEVATMDKYERRLCD